MLPRGVDRFTGFNRLDNVMQTESAETPIQLHLSKYIVDLGA
jgi:hypothetical protein